MEPGRAWTEHGGRSVDGPGTSRCFDLNAARARWDEFEGAPTEQARALGAELARWIETFYVGLDAVRARGFDPVAALRSAQRVRDIERVFTDLGDRHTFVSFQNIACRRGCETALETVGQLQLPVRIGTAARSASPKELERFWITEVAAGAGAAPQVAELRRGDEVTHWNGVPLERVVRRLGEELRGAHAHAQRRLGVRALTRRVVEPGRLPEEDWVVLTCLRAGRVTHHRLEWTDRLLEWGSRVGLHEPVRGGDRVRIGHLGEPDEMADVLDGLESQRSSGRPLLLDLRGNAGGSVLGALSVFEAVSGRSAASRLRFQFRASERLAEDASRCSRWRRWTGADRGGFFPPHRIDDGSGAPAGGGPGGTADGVNPSLSGCVPGRVAVLVDASTFSAAEILTALLRAAGATVIGTDPCTGGGPDNGWSLAALRRLCPEAWISFDANEQDPAGALGSYCADQGLQVRASWTEKAMLHWRLCADEGSPAPARLAIWRPDAPESIAIYVFGRSLKTLGRRAVDLQLSVRRPLIRAGGDWHPIGRLKVDHLVLPTRRDLVENDVDLLQSAFRILAGDARVAPSGSETLAPHIA